MSNVITFIKTPVVNSFTPQTGFGGDTFIITGDNLEDVKDVCFIDVFGGKLNASFNFQVNPATQDTKLVGTVPMIDATLGEYLVRVENSLGYSDFCCFKPWVATQTNIQNISGDDAVQIDDKYAINDEINDTPTNTQGFEVLNLSYIPISSQNKLLIQCEISLQSSFWGSAVLALFKDNETTPRKTWNYALMGLNFGQVAKLGYVADAGSHVSQTWRLRVGRTHNTYPIIYVNRSVESAVPYGGATSSWMTITEIDN